MCRVLALKLLCEIRLDKDDLRAAVELAMKPPKAPSRPPSGKSTRSGGPNRGRAEAAQEQQLELHHEPLGEDGDDVMWWYLDMGHANQTGPSGKKKCRHIGICDQLGACAKQTEGVCKVLWE